MNINKFDKEIFATQPIQKHDKSWVAFVYCSELGNKPLENSTIFATEKQRAFLRFNKIPFKENITKQEAFKIIQEVTQK